MPESKRVLSGPPQAYVVVKLIDFSNPNYHKILPFLRHAQIVSLMFIFGAAVFSFQIWRSVDRGEPWIGADGSIISLETMRAWRVSFFIVIALAFLFFLILRYLARKIILSASMK